MGMILDTILKDQIHQLAWETIAVVASGMPGKAIAYLMTMVMGCFTQASWVDI